MTAPLLLASLPVRFKTTIKPERYLLTPSARSRKTQGAQDLTDS